MTTKNSTKIFLLVLAFVMVSCSDPFFDGKFEVSFHVENKTDSPMVFEHENVSIDSILVMTIQPDEESGHVIGRYEGSRKETKPSDEFVNEKLSHVTIYRMLDDSTRQYLPRECFDEAGKLYSYVQPEFVIYEAHYQLTVTEDMFPR